MVLVSHHRIFPCFRGFCLTLSFYGFRQRETGVQFEPYSDNMKETATWQRYVVLLLGFLGSSMGFLWIF